MECTNLGHLRKYRQEDNIERIHPFFDSQRARVEQGMSKREHLSNSLAYCSSWQTLEEYLLQIH